MGAEDEDENEDKVGEVEEADEEVEDAADEEVPAGEENEEVEKVVVEDLS
jgi:hypothetical protein